jgi:hypothetical protein
MVDAGTHQREVIIVILSLLFMCVRGATLRLR